MNKTCSNCEKSYWSEYSGYVCGLYDEEVSPDDPCEDWSGYIEPEMRTFNISLCLPDNNVDETQFNIQNGSFEDMFNEIISLVRAFIQENPDLKGSEILEIREVPYTEN